LESQFYPAGKATPESDVPQFVKQWVKDHPNIYKLSIDQQWRRFEQGENKNLTPHAIMEAGYIQEGSSWVALGEMPGTFKGSGEIVSLERIDDGATIYYVGQAPQRGFILWCEINQS
jgi:hypothetical protein